MSKPRVLEAIIEEREPVRHLFSHLSRIETPDDVNHPISPDDAEYLEPSESGLTVIELLQEAITSPVLEIEYRARESHAAQRAYDAFNNGVEYCLGLKRLPGLKSRETVMPVTAKHAVVRTIYEIADLMREYPDSWHVDFLDLVHCAELMMQELTKIGDIKGLTKLFLPGNGTLYYLLLGGVGTDLQDPRGLLATKIGIKTIYLDRSPKATDPAGLLMGHYDEMRMEYWRNKIDKSLKEKDKAAIVIPFQYLNELASLLGPKGITINERYRV